MFFLEYGLGSGSNLRFFNFIISQISWIGWRLSEGAGRAYKDMLKYNYISIKI